MPEVDSTRVESQIDGLRQRAQLYAEANQVSRDDMSLAFEPTWATELELLPGGHRFFPRIGDDMEAAEHSILHPVL